MQFLFFILNIDLTIPANIFRSLYFLYTHLMHLSNYYLFIFLFLSIYLSIISVFLSLFCLQVLTYIYTIATPISQLLTVFLGG